MISDRKQLEQTAVKLGILPFFANNVPGLSVEELVEPGLLFGSSDTPGAWEWKGPVIRERTTAYGKFFNRKAGFVSRELLPDFLNFRRTYRHPGRLSEAEDAIMSMLRGAGELTSAQMRAELFGTGKRTEDDLVDILPQESKPSRGILEPALQRLQMAGLVLISDFVYKQSKRGERYGWGTALYSTPEEIYGSDIARCPRSGSESGRIISEHVLRNFPFATMDEIKKLLR
ncbi:MAG: hypothetical protein K2I69_00910 [Muribaculaceae bacterium]|nr:hypothetical protein [Muribaculaceae bacterium]